MTGLTTHGCGKSWRQRGNRTSHCGGETWSAVGLAMTFNGSHGDGSWRRTDLTDSAFEGRESPERVDVAGDTVQAVEAQNRHVSEAVLS